MTIKLDNDKVSKIRMDLKLAEILSTTSKLPDHHRPTNLKLTKACILIMCFQDISINHFLDFTIGLNFPAGLTMRQLLRRRSGAIEQNHLTLSSPPYLPLPDSTPDA